MHQPKNADGKQEEPRNANELAQTDYSTDVVSLFQERNENENLRVRGGSRVDYTTLKVMYFTRDPRVTRTLDLAW